MNDAELLQVQAAQLQRYTVWSLIALLVWMAVEVAFTELSLLASLVVWLVQAIGLLWFLPGLRRGNASSAAWLGYVLMLYFIFAVLSAFAPGLKGQLAMIECLLIVGVFVLTIRFVKAKRATQGGAL
ncbi:DUF2069 domain-containing protein [Perlucidibaca aquatica]|uniref:DUF2069 domain-containing protein n=1 Tax=Perlucidibaca aquatica TaxID=1852776 RepID=UPI00083B2B19|nr:DUF2069 domain-containing protein [Perlucidibaca aquatica]